MSLLKVPRAVYRRFLIWYDVLDDEFSVLNYEGFRTLQECIEFIEFQWKRGSWMVDYDDDEPKMN